jgi:hypothetical protein
VDDVQTLTLKSLSGKKGMYRLLLLPDALVVEAVEGEERIEIPFAEVAERAEMTQFWPLSPVLTVQIPKKVVFNLSRADAETIRSWWPPATVRELQMLLRRGQWWEIGLGIFFIWASLPYAGNPDAGIDPSPFDPVAAAVGVGLLLFVALSRWMPTRGLLLSQCAACTVALVSVIIRVATGRSHWAWLILAWLLASSVRQQFRQWQRFASLSEPSDTAPPPGAEDGMSSESDE